MHLLAEPGRRLLELCRARRPFGTRDDAGDLRPAVVSVDAKAEEHLLVVAEALAEPPETVLCLRSQVQLGAGALESGTSRLPWRRRRLAACLASV
jgi:hypothetical protein